MRLINGEDVQTLLGDGPLKPDRAVRITEQIASALQAAHQVGLVHRDVKPSNILVTEDDFAYLIDFGIARAAGETDITSTGATIGTWSYMAPERFRSGEIEPSSDIYALACVLYQSLTGQLPFPGTTLEQVAMAHMTAPPPRPSTQRRAIPMAMDDVISIGLAKNPDQRYQTAKDLALAAWAALTTREQAQADTIMADIQVATDPLIQDECQQNPPAATSGTSRWWLHPATVIAGGMGLLLVGALIFVGIQLSRNRQIPPSATPTSALTLTPQATPPSPPVATTAPPPPATPSTTTTITTSSAHAEPTETSVSGGSCSDLGKLARDSNTGKELYCAMFSQDHWMWLEAPANVTGLHTTNSSCDPRLEVMARSPDGYLITCQVPAGAISPYKATWQHFQSMLE
jgi:serine/threonine protein kinase